MTNTVTTTRPQWLDLILYVLIGFGLPIVVDVILLQLTNGLIPPAWFSMIVSVVLLVSLGGIVLVLGALRRRFGPAVIGLTPLRWEWRWLDWAGRISLGLILAGGVFAAVTNFLWDDGVDVILTRESVVIFQDFSWLSFFTSFFLVGILSPVAEELFFRGAIYQWFRGRFGIKSAVVSSALLFAAGHTESLRMIGVSLLAGILFALVVERTKSLWAAITVHAFYNMLMVILFFGLTALFPAVGLP